MDTFTMAQLETYARLCKEEGKPLQLTFELPNLSQPEVIINPHCNIDEKLEYYRQTYDENCVNKFNPAVRITGTTDMLVSRIPGSFEWAMAQLADGRKVRRSHWYEGDCLYLVKGITIPSDRLRNEALKHLSANEMVRTHDHIDRFYAADNTIKVGWVPTLEDFFAKDWWVH